MPLVCLLLSGGLLLALVPETYARRVCNGIAQLGMFTPNSTIKTDWGAKYATGARGASVLFASGDFGVGDGNSDPDTQTCFTNDGRNVTRFRPTFPST